MANAQITPKQMIHTGEQALIRSYLERIAVPIFYRAGKDIEARGTGTLLDLNNRLYLITASHIFDDCDPSEFASPWGRTNAPINTWGETQRLSARRGSIAPDVAIVELQSPDTTSALRQNYPRLGISQIGLPTLDQPHILAGFPSELATPTGTHIDQLPLIYSTQMLAEWPDGDVEDPNPAWDLFFRLDRRVEMPTGETREMPNLQGASGGVIWELVSQQGPLWTPNKSLRAVGIQRSAKTGAWFRGTNWLAVIPLLTQFDRPAGYQLAVQLLGDENAADLFRRSGYDLPA